MKLSDFHFDLPNELIARFPLSDRSACRLLSLDGETGQLNDEIFTDILDKIKPGDLLILNNTKVIPARLYGQKATGGKFELLIERILDEKRALVHLKASKPPKIGNILFFGEHNEFKATMIARQDALFELQFEDPILATLDKIGHMPLPPYIDRPDNEADKEEYQTVYGQIPGAVAAPTAGLHFDEALIDKLKAKGVLFEFVTLHVGAGTFQPVRVEDIKTHQMHAEYVEVPEAVVKAVQACKQRGNKVIAVGTTSVRSLESAAKKTGQIEAFFGDTRIFIYPGYQFNVVDALITNFHLPESTLIMLVSAFAGYENTMNAYQHAVQENYRFFSYGDAMYITKK